MTRFPLAPKTIKELDEQLLEMYETTGRPDDWKERREWLIKIHDLKEESDAE